MRWLYLLIVLALAGCSVGCDDEGCGNDLRFSAAMLSLWIGSETFSVEVCADGDCQTLNVTDVSASDWFGFPLDPSISGDIDLAVTVATDTSVKQATGSVAVASYRPNGRFCSPVCSGADVTIDGETLSNAESGSIAPRD